MTSGSSSSSSSSSSSITLLRPGVVWFGEGLDWEMLRGVDGWIARPDGRGVDLMLVVGTSAAVYPAAGYVDKARAAGAQVAVVNLDADAGDDADFAFAGDAAELLPQLLEPVIGKAGDDGTFAG